MLINEIVLCERRKRKLSQTCIAEMMGMSVRTYRKYETGGIDFTLKQIIKLSAVFKMNTLSIIYEELISICKRNNANSFKIIANGQTIPYFSPTELERMLLVQQKLQFSLKN